MTFSASQQKAYDAVQKGDNVFITASAGYGKSYLTRAITTPNTVVVAPTGIAALNVGGATCHRTFGLPIGLVQPKDKYIIPKSMGVFSGNNVKRIIFSEIGMVRTDQLELIDARLKYLKNNKLPFGGIQVVVEGDFCLQKGTLITMADGTLSKIEDVKIGDTVMGVDGTPRTVLNLFNGEAMLYQVKQTNGKTYCVTGNHTLALRRSNSPERFKQLGDYPNVLVKDFLGKSQKFKKVFGGYRVKLNNYTETPLKLDPYFLGLWLS